MHRRMYGRNDQILRDFYGDTLSAAEITRRGKKRSTAILSADAWRRR
jgi:hypothetical protein